MPRVEMTLTFDLPEDQQAWLQVVRAMSGVQGAGNLKPVAPPSTPEPAETADPGDNLVPMRPRPAAPQPSQLPQDPEARAAEIKLNRQRAAAAARAAKEAKSGMPVTDVLGPNGQDQDEPGEEILDDPAMSPGEAHDAALAIIRRHYYAGKEAEVQALRKEYGVTRFTDIPQEKGHELYRKARKLAQSLGIS